MILSSRLKNPVLIQSHCANSKHNYKKKTVTVIAKERKKEKKNDTYPQTRSPIQNPGANSKYDLEKKKKVSAGYRNKKKRERKKKTIFQEKKIEWHITSIHYQHQITIPVTHFQHPVKRNLQKNKVRDT